MTMTKPGAQALTRDLDEAVVALTAFDVERLEAVEMRIRAVTAEHLVASRDWLHVIQLPAYAPDTLRKTPARGPE